MQRRVFVVGVGMTKVAVRPRGVGPSAEESP